MILGIVGSEGAKFTKDGEWRARDEIKRAMGRYMATTVCSGACHLGGIDIWAVQEARAADRTVIEYAPAVLQWGAKGGYKDRNLLIADKSDVVICITVDRLPPEFTGMRFNRCYHCGTDKHVKSGGCWTVKQARNAGKHTEIIVVENT